MALKTYVLLPVLDADAPVYQKTADDQRIQVKKIPFWHPYLRIAFQDKDGMSKVHRYKASAVLDGKPVIDQREQIDKLKIDANEPFTRNEKKDMEFRGGVLFTSKLSAQAYLEAYPGFEGFEGTCDEIREPQFKLLDPGSEVKIKNSDIRMRVKAANKVVDMELEEAQQMLIRLNGSFFQTPQASDYQGTPEEQNEAAKQECQNMLMNFIDDAEEGGLNAVLKEDKDMNVDEKTTVLIGKLINENLLSFDKVQGKVSRKGTDDKWIEVREMSDEYSLEERKRLFSDFLNTEDGKALKNDLEKLAGIEKKRVGRPPNT